jgi:hypothetical protein
MMLRTINARHSQLERPGLPTAELKITGAFKVRGEATIDEGTYFFTPDNFWQTKWLVSRNDQPVARLALFSKIELLDERGSKVVKTYKFKKKGVFSLNYEMLNATGNRRIFDLETSSKWYSSRPLFDVKPISPVSNEKELAELLICCAFMIGMQQLQASVS